MNARNHLFIRSDSLAKKYDRDSILLSDWNNHMSVNAKRPRFLVMAGEASGDHHLAALIGSLKEILPDLEVYGIGGERLQSVGVHLFHHYKEINTIGFSGGLSKLRRVISAYKTMKNELMSGKYDLFIPVDFPDVNIRLCKFAKKSGTKVCYYISPQVWAWRKGRIHKIKDRVDTMMTIFPFEEDLYRDVGLEAHFVGHTMVSEVSAASDKGRIRTELGLSPDAWIVTLAPGSRSSEIDKTLPLMLQAARIHSSVYKETQFVLPVAGPHLFEHINRICSQSGVSVLILEEQASKLMVASDSGLICSGTASLQAALAELPHAVVYLMDNFTWFLASRILKPILMDPDIHVAIANVLSIKMEQSSINGPISSMLESGYHIKCDECGRPLFVPELLQSHATAETMAHWLNRFRNEPALCDSMKKGFQQIREYLIQPDQDKNTVSVVLGMLTR